MTYKYTTIRIQRKEALLGYTVPIRKEIKL